MNTHASYAQRSLSDLIVDDVRAISILERYGLDYCCKGHQTLEQAARTRGASLDEVVGALASLGDRTEPGYPAEWQDLSALTRHIVEHHHGYVRRITPTLTAWLEKLVARHANKHPEISQIREIFGDLAEDLATHMAKEEGLLFPFIDE